MKTMHFIAGNAQRHWLRIVLALLMAALPLLAAPLASSPVLASSPAQEPPDPERPNACSEGVQSSGALYQVCVPESGWNDDLVVYAHGYVSITETLRLPPESSQIQPVVNSLGYAYATTSYSVNGLAIKDGMADLLDLVEIFAAQHATVNRVYLVGFSEGGLITTLLTEQHPEVFDGGLAMCGPYGNFNGQVEHFGDFRIVFDYFFPALLPDSPISIPQSLIDQWSSYAITVKQAVSDPLNAGAVEQLLAVTGAAYDLLVPSTITETVEGLLWYNVFATNDATLKLGGQPFDNQSRTYSGSLDDAALNAGVARFSASAAARQEIDAFYQTSGKLSVPLVTMHTTGDPIVPYWHLPLYRSKTFLADNIALNYPITVQRYGHCSFTTFEILSAFNQMVALVKNPPAYQAAHRLYLPVLSH